MSNTSFPFYSARDCLASHSSVRRARFALRGFPRRLGPFRDSLRALEANLKLLAAEILATETAAIRTNFAAESVSQILAK